LAEGDVSIQIDLQTVGSVPDQGAANCRPCVAHPVLAAIVVMAGIGPPMPGAEFKFTISDGVHAADSEETANAEDAGDEAGCGDDE
jgi:hypothetical protein